MKERVIYEVLRVIDGKPLFLENHLERMKNSFNLINEKFLLKSEDICAKINKLIKSEDKNIGNVKITYNVNEKKLDVFFIEHFYPSQDMYKDGVKTILYFGERENPNAKIINNDFRSKVTEKIKENNAFEAILIDRNGFITEGSKSNIFMVKDNKLLTSEVKAVLPGVTRSKIIEVASNNGIEIKEVAYNYKDIDKLDGMFISGTSPKVLPINSVGDIKLNANNELIGKIMKLYNEEVERYIENH